MTAPSRLLLAIHSAKLGGAQAVALGQARALAHDHELVIAIGYGPLRAPFGELGPLVRAPTRLPIWGAARRRWAIDIARAAPDAVRLAGEIRRRRVQAVVANSSVLVSPVLAARLAGVPSIVHIQEAPKSVAARRLFRFHGALADVVVVISPAAAASFAGARATVLVNPVGIPIPEAPVPRRREPGAPLSLLVVGTLDRHKRQDVAIAALADLRSRGVDARLTLVGPCGDTAYQQGLLTAARDAGIADDVDLTGPSSDVPAALRGADVLLVPGGEVTPLVIMEAMAHGTPVVAARMGAIGDIVDDGVTGLLVEPGDAAGCADAVQRVADGSELAQALVASARSHVERHLDEAQSHAVLSCEIQRVIAALEGAG